MVYVDDMQAKLGRMVMCHMIADTDHELREMAVRIGVAIQWHQYPGTPRSHFDICQSKRALAVAAGAQQISWRQTGIVSAHRRKARLGQSVPLPISQILAINQPKRSHHAHH